MTTRKLPLPSIGKYLSGSSSNRYRRGWVDTGFRYNRNSRRNLCDAYLVEFGSRGADDCD
jgi:hypothetical protein